MGKEKRNACANSDKALTCGFVASPKSVRDSLVRECNRNVGLFRGGFGTVGSAGGRRWGAWWWQAVGRRGETFGSGWA